MITAKKLAKSVNWGIVKNFRVKLSPAIDLMATSSEDQKITILSVSSRCKRAKHTISDFPIAIGDRDARRQLLRRQGSLSSARGSCLGPCHFSCLCYGTHVSASC